MICPNLSDPNIRKQFNDLSQIVGEDFAYFLWDKNNGLPLHQRLDKRAKLDKVIGNKFYEKLEDSFKGDSRAATLAMSITFGNNFKKANPEFDNKSSAQKVKAVKEFIDRKKGTVEDISQSYIRQSARASAIRRENFYGVLDVTREQLEQDPNSLLNNMEPTTALDQLDAYVNFQKSEISKHINFVNMSNIVNSGAYATWSKNALTVYRGSEKTDLYHESFHEFTQKFLSKEERTELYASVRDREGSVKIGEISIPYYALTDRQTEEILAEEYRAYAITRTKSPEKLEKPVRTIFQKIQDFLKSFFTGVPVEQKKITFKDLQNSKVGEVFETLYTSNFSRFSLDNTNVSFDLLNRSIGFSLDYENESGKNTFDLTPQETFEVFGFIDYTLYNKMRADKVSITSLMDKKFRSQYVSSLYNFARNEVEVLIDDLTSQIESTKSLSAKERLENTRSYLRLLVHSEENWKKVVDHHQENIQGEIFKTTLAKEDSQDKLNDDKDESEQTKSVGIYDDPGASNPLQFYDPYVVELIRSLPDKRIVDGEVQLVRGNLLGLPASGNFLYNKNLLQDALSGLTSYKDVINKIQSLVEYNPQMADLLELLPSPDSVTLTPVELSLKAQIMQSLTMPQIPPFTVRAKASEEIVSSEEVSPAEKGDQEKKIKQRKKSALTLSTFSVNTLTQDALAEFLDTEFQLSASRAYRGEVDNDGYRKFANTTNEGLDFATFSVSSALDSYEILPNSPDKVIFDFLQDSFGINLTQGKAKVLFDKKGQIRKSVSPYSPGTIAAIRKMALSAYKKMQLYELVYNLPLNDKYRGLKNLVPRNIETPAGTFLSDLRTDIYDRIVAMNKPLAKEEEFKPVYDFLTANFNKKEFLNNERVLLYKAIENYYYVTKSGSFLNEEGNMEWSIRERQHLAYQIEKINAAQNINELTGHLNPNRNNFIGKSALMRKMFNEGGERLIGKSRMPVTMRLDNFTGFSDKKTINLDVDDKYVQDLAAFLKEGIVENMRNGAKSSTFAIRVGESRGSRIYYGFDKFGYNPETKKITLAPEVIDQFKDYLEFEMARIYDDSNQKDTLNAKETRGAQFIIFNDILPKDVKKEIIDSLRTSEKSKEETIKALANSIGYVSFEDYLTNFFSTEMETSINELAQAINGGRIEGTKKLPSLQERFKDVFGDYDIYPTLASYITNYYTHQVEYLHLLVGDPSNFGIKPKDIAANNWREVFKRLGASISPGRQPIIDDQDLTSRNSNAKLGRKLEALVSPNNVRDYTKNFSYVQFKDIKTFDNETQSRLYREAVIDSYAEHLKSLDKKKKDNVFYKAQAEDDLGLALDSVIRQDKESDAQAYGNLDFLRFYLDSVGEWTPQLEELYQNEVKIMEKVLEYRETADPKVYGQIKALQAKVNLGALPSLKLGYWGSPVEDTNYVMLGKYSVAPLLPSALFETDLEDLMVNMLEGGVDFATFDSGSKMSSPRESIPFYKTEKVIEPSGKSNEVLKTNDIEQENLITLPIEGLRRQQYIAPKFKGEATLSTQMVKLAFSNFYEGGEIRDEIKAVPGLEQKITKAINAFKTNIDVVVQTEKAKIFSSIGATVDQEGGLVSFDTAKFADWIKSEFDKKDIPQAVYDYLKVQDNKFLFALDVSPHRQLIENVISTSISKRVLKPKMFGEAFIQTASSGFNKSNTRFVKPTKAQVEKYGVSGLRDYGRIVNGKHQPADIKIAFNHKKYGGLLELEWDGEIIDNLTNLNKALMDDQWVEEHSDKLTIVGVRIPVQGFNSMEHFRVREFLSESAGPIIIVPPSLVTKSGGDFDIDKLFMYEPELDQEGNLKQADSRFKKNPKTVYNYVAARKELLDSLKAHQDLLKNKLEEFKSKYDSQQTAVQVLEKHIANNGMILNFDKSKLSDQEKSEIFDSAFDQLTFLEKLTEASKDDAQVRALYESIKAMRSKYAEVAQYSPGKIKSGFSNELIQSLSSVLSEPAIMKQMLKPNDSPILKKIANHYNEVYKKGKGRISSSRMFTPSVSLQIFKENAMAKKGLGTAAKMNALHKLYQQTGLRYTNEFFMKNYLMRANKVNNSINLGGYYDANNEHLISDLIDEFINGFVDVEKEDWVNYFNADNKRAPIILQMVLNGTPIEDAILLVNQPIVQHYLKNSRLNSTSRLLGEKSSGVMNYLREGLTALGKKKFIGFTNNIPDLNKTINNILKDDYFTKHIRNMSEESYAPSVDNTREAYDNLLEAAKQGESTSELAAQIAFMTQYHLVSEQNKDLLNLNSAIDFNTARYITLNDFHRVVNTIKEESDNFNQDGINKILKDSVVSPFNLTKEAIAIGENAFSIMGMAWYQDFLNDFTKEYGKYWAPDERSTEVNNLNNAIMHGIIQQYSFSEEDDVDYYLEYGPNSGYLTQNGVGNLRSKFTELFRKKTQENSELKDFAQNNLFLKNFKTKNVENTNKFYVAMETNERDPIMVDSMQKSFQDGLNYGLSTPGSGDVNLDEQVRQFFHDVASATIMGQGFTIKYRSLQPYLPLDALDAIVPAMDEMDTIAEKVKVVPGEVSEDRMKLLAYMQQILKLHNKVNGTKTSALNNSRYFPDYRSGVKGIRISPYKTQLSAMLSPNTTLAKSKGNLKTDWKVEFNGKKYEDAWAAYTKTKDVLEREGKISGKRQELLTNNMTDILEARFLQNSRMFGALYDKGGLEFLENSYVEGLSAEWNSTPLSRGWYIDSLKAAYERVLPEMEEAWVNREPTSEKMIDSETSETMEDPSADYVPMDFTEEDSLESLAQESGLKIKDKSSTVKEQEPAELSEEDLTYGIELPNGETMSLSYDQITAENLKQYFPQLTAQQAAKAAEAFRQELRDNNPGYDFETKC